MNEQNIPAVVPEILFQNVWKAFAGRPVLSGASFAVGSGEALCLMGRSGTGKSVTLKLMVGLLKPDSGNIRIHSENLNVLDEDALSRLRRKTGFLFQSSGLFSQFSLNDNLVLPLQRFTGKSKQEIDALVQKQLDDVGLSNDRYKMPAELSGGMRKRAGLARALVLEPSILLADEPTSGLDSVTAREIDDLLLKLKEKGKTTMAIVTHDIRGARHVGDRLAILDQGQIIASGSFRELQEDKNALVRALVSQECRHED